MTNVLDNFLDHYCQDVGWSFTASAQIEGEKKLELNYTTHNTNTREVLECIKEITGKVPVKVVKISVFQTVNIFCLATVYERASL